MLAKGVWLKTSALLVFFPWLVTTLIGPGLLELLQLIYPKLSTGFDMLVFYKNLSLVEFWVRFLALFRISLVDGVE